MTRLPWETRGARLQLPRDLRISYLVGRMGVATPYDLWPLFWGSLHTARIGFRRLVRLGLLRTFARAEVSHPAWYSLTARGAAWVGTEFGCDEQELRLVTGVGRVNLGAVRVRNRLWVSVVLACRATPGVQLALFRPEWELRVMRSAAVPVVPDAMVVLADRDPAATPSGWAWLVEFDTGTEHLAVWERKAKALAGMSGRPLYGALRWNVLVRVPNLRRAQAVASAVVRGGAARLVYVSIEGSLDGGRALDTALWRTALLAASPDAVPTDSLRSGAKTALGSPDQRPRSAVDGGSARNRTGTVGVSVPTTSAPSLKIIGASTPNLPRGVP